MDTIFALATARGKSGVGIVRISGAQSRNVLKKLCGDVPASHKASLRFLKDADGEVLDQALVLFFVSPNSFTGEDVVELHLHGSIAVENAVLNRLATMPGLRHGEAGEFTRRALENNRLDLAQVEGLADLIEAETEVQRKQAMRVFSGGLGEKVTKWRAQAIRAAALLEATIDFADEDVPEDVTGEVMELIADLNADLTKESEGSKVSERIREGFEVAIVGAPNVGKSTLLNALAGREAAITSQYAGTTRDVIEVRMDLNGLPVTFLDTAGLRETGDHVEKIGVQRAVQRAEEADLRIFLVENDELPEWLELGEGDIVIEAKSDIREARNEGVSGLTGKGVSKLISRIVKVLEGRAKLSQTAIRARHRVAIDRAFVAFALAGNELEVGLDRLELAAEELRTGIRALDSLIGRVDVEDLLDEIFSSFCLGK
ncbi:MAG: tRNA uridine-5-carboxymethylaminomethyl(34) synthesis GTPase MnmE [Rhodobacteraceae bacterium]|nr:tRNA uridine-5-carboxymethylaminomethyl(34) synthesis GTPase MnmE [Paracoccaceae bacterium]